MRKNTRTMIKKYVACDEQRIDQYTHTWLSDGIWSKNEDNATLYNTAEYALAMAKQHDARIPHCVVVTIEF